MLFLFKSIIFVKLIQQCIQQDVELKVKNVTLKIKGHSGKIVLSRVYSNPKESDSLEIRFGSITEKDMNGTEVGKTGSVKHSFNNFAQLDFEVMPVVETTFQNLSVFQTSLNAKIVTNVTSFTGTFYIFKQNGTIDTGNNNFQDVKERNVKFSIEIKNWPFCKPSDQCTGPNCCINQNVNEIGSFIDFTLELSGSKNPSNSSSYKYDLGNGQFILSQYCMLDNSWTKLPNNYPNYSHDNNTEYFTFRFPTFQKTLMYDPIVQIGIEDTSKSHLALIIGIIIGVILAIAIVSVGIYCYKKRNSQTTENLI